MREDRQFERMSCIGMVIGKSAINLQLLIHYIYIEVIGF
jgi:hypothetical protein